MSNDATNPLVAAYGFNEGSGTTVTDASVYGNTGTINGASWTSQGRFGNALNFDGASWVTVNDSDALDLSTGMTLEAWAYPTATPTTWMTIVLKESPPSNLAYMMQANPANHPIAYISTDAAGLQGVEATTSPSPQYLDLPGCDLRWHHALACTSMALTWRVNRSRAAFSLPEGLSALAATLFGANTLLGTIDEVRLYNRALSQTEIQADMNTPIVLPTPSPTPTPTPTSTPTPTPTATLRLHYADADTHPDSHSNTNTNASGADHQPLDAYESSER